MGSCPDTDIDPDFFRITWNEKALVNLFKDYKLRFCWSLKKNSRA